MEIDDGGNRGILSLSNSATWFGPILCQSQNVNLLVISVCAFLFGEVYWCFEDHLQTNIVQFTWYLVKIDAFRRLPDYSLNRIWGWSKHFNVLKQRINHLSAFVWNIKAEPFLLNDEAAYALLKDCRKCFYYPTWFLGVLVDNLKEKFHPHI